MHGQAHNDASQSTKKQSFTRTTRGVSYSPTPPVKPSQHTMAAHFHHHSTYSTASVHITHATPTGSPMDPHPQTFRSTTPLTQPPLFLSPPNHQPPTDAVSCMHARGLFTTNDDLDNDPRPTSLTPAPPSHPHPLSLTHPNLPTSIYVLIYPKPIFPPHPTFIRSFRIRPARPDLLGRED